MEKSFLAFVEQSIKQNWDLDALTDYKGATLQYKDLARKIEKLHILLEESGVQPGDKVAICGRNSSHWGVAFLATLTYGAIAVPILHEFKADTIHNIVNHSDARLLFVGDMAWESLNEAEILGRHYPDDRLHPVGMPKQAIGICPRASERNVRTQIPAQFPARTCLLPA